LGLAEGVWNSYAPFFAGLATGQLMGAPYTISKHGVVAVSELLYKNLKLRAARLSASVLCPGWVNTNILDSERNRPAELATPGAAPVALSAQQQALHDAVRGFLEHGFQPGEVAAQVVDAIRGEQFYIVPVQPEIEAGVALRLEDIRLRRNPTMAAPPG
jgi:NAD(P)-dependent dehydrogenase (short-subunit alcohol dehydrogenase family)